LQAQKLLEKINIGKEAIELDEIRDLIEQLKFCNMQEDAKTIQLLNEAFELDISMEN